MITPLPEAVFGWDGDGGIGETLIDQILAGEKWATCGFKADYSAEELKATYDGVGRVFSARSATGRPRAVIRVTDVFECPFGAPDPRLVAGEGDGVDVEKFQRDHRAAWEATMGDAPLSDDELLVVELFELVGALETP